MSSELPLAITRPDTSGTTGFRTRELLAFSFVATAVVAFANVETIGDRETFLALVGDRLSGEQAASQHILMSRFQLWSIAIAPILSVVRVVVVALTLQLPLLLVLSDVTLRSLLRLASVASLPLLGGAAVQLIALGQAADAARRVDVLVRPWGSLAALSDLPKGPTLSLLAQLNVFEASWLIIVAVGLGRLMGGRVSAGLAIAVLTWVILSSLTIGLGVLMGPDH